MRIKSANSSVYLFLHERFGELLRNLSLSQKQIDKIKSYTVKGLDTANKQRAVLLNHNKESLKTNNTKLENLEEKFINNVFAHNIMNIKEKGLLTLEQSFNDLGTLPSCGDGDTIIYNIIRSQIIYLYIDNQLINLLINKLTFIKYHKLYQKLGVYLGVAFDKILLP